MIPANTDFNTEITLEVESQSLPEEPPFHILFLGDWSGRENRFGIESTNFHPIIIDRDNFDTVISKLNVSLLLDLNGDDSNLLSLHFNRLEDFHPDNIFRQVPIFSDLRDVRKRLLNHDTFENAAREVRSWFAEKIEIGVKSVEPELEKVENTSSLPRLKPENLLDQILNQSDGDSSPPQVQNIESPELSSLVNKLVKPHLIKTDEQEQIKLLQIVDDTTSELMRSILHHPHFKTLESAWRGLYLVIRNVETSNKLKLFILNVSKNEITDDLKFVKDLSESQVYKVLIKDTIETPEGDPWSVICANYQFNVDIEDIALLIRLSKLGANSNAPFISYIKPEMLGVSPLSDLQNSQQLSISENSPESKLWTTLRSMPESKYLGLAMPQILTRLPYGEATEPTETFSFEEFNTDSTHNDYLWTNPSFVCGLLLAQSFSVYGWEMGQKLFQEINGLPVHFYKEDGEIVSKPCAENIITESDCEKILDQGLMPILSSKNSDKIQLARYQSVSTPFSWLGGRWS